MDIVHDLTDTGTDLCKQAAKEILRLRYELDRKEKMCEGLSNVLTEMIAAQQTGKPKRKAKHSIPPDWQASEELLAWVRDTFPDLDGPNEADGFKDYWLSGGDTKLDWDRAFRTWCRNADRWSARTKSRRSGTSAYASPDQVSERNRERIRDILGELDEK